MEFISHEFSLDAYLAISYLPFQGNMLLINKIRDNLPTECITYGEVKKVIIFDVNYIL